MKMRGHAQLAASCGPAAARAYVVATTTHRRRQAKRPREPDAAGERCARQRRCGADIDTANRAVGLGSITSPLPMKWRQRLLLERRVGRVPPAWQPCPPSRRAARLAHARAGPACRSAQRAEAAPRRQRLRASAPSRGPRRLLAEWGAAMASPSKTGATEQTPLITPPAKVMLDDETSSTLRDRVTTSYTTIALVSALLAGVSFLAYATPPAQLFSAAGGSAAAAAIAPTPAPRGKHQVTKSEWQQWSHDVEVFTYKAMFDIYGVGACALRRRPRAGGLGTAVSCCAQMTLPAVPRPDAHALRLSLRVLRRRAAPAQWCRSRSRSTWLARFARRVLSSSSTASPPRRS